MKKILFGLIATVMFGFVGSAQDKNFVSFFSSKEFNQLSNKFSIKNTDIDTKNYASLSHESKLYKIYRVSVTLQGNKNFITFFTDNDGKNYALSYENIDFSKNISQHFDEYGNLYAIFDVIKSDTNYNFKIREAFNPTTFGGQANYRVDCISKTYRTLKNACQADDFCDMMCDLNPSCLPMLAAWAATYCASR